MAANFYNLTAASPEPQSEAAAVNAQKAKFSLLHSQTRAIRGMLNNSWKLAAARTIHGEKRIMTEIKHEVIATSKAPQAIGPYSQAIRLGNLVFCSGQIPLDPEKGTIVGTTAAEQTEQVLKNLRSVLEAAGSSLKHVIKTTCFLSDMADFAEFNNVYSRFFTDKAPARSAIQAAALPKGVKVEVEAIAYLA